jgi:hypothetical protein
MEEGKEADERRAGADRRGRSRAHVWWDTRGVHGILQDLVRMVLWAERSAFRLYVPPGMLTAASARPLVTRSARRRSTRRWRSSGRTIRATRRRPCTRTRTRSSSSACSSSRAIDGEIDPPSSVSSGEKTIIRKLDRRTDDPAAKSRCRSAATADVRDHAAALITEQIQEVAARAQPRGVDAAAERRHRRIPRARATERADAWPLGEGPRQPDEVRALRNSTRAPAPRTSSPASSTRTRTGKTILATPDVAGASRFRRARGRREERALSGHPRRGEAGSHHRRHRPQARLEVARAAARRFRQGAGPHADADGACGRWLLETALAMAEAFMGQPGHYTRSCARSSPASRRAVRCRWTSGKTIAIPRRTDSCRARRRWSGTASTTSTRSSVASAANRTRARISRSSRRTRSKRSR